jgi:hypothetical protein
MLPYKNGGGLPAGGRESLMYMTFHVVMTVITQSICDGGSLVFNKYLTTDCVK